MGEGVSVTLGVMVGVDSGMAEGVAVGVEVAAGERSAHPRARASASIMRGRKRIMVRGVYHLG